MKANKKVTRAKTQVNWDLVFEARKRGKQGHATQEDHELCHAAFKEDPAKYAEVSGRAEKEACNEANPWHMFSKKG